MVGPRKWSVYRTFMVMITQNVLNCKSSIHTHTHIMVTNLQDLTCSLGITIVSPDLQLPRSSSCTKTSLLSLSQPFSRLK